MLTRIKKFRRDLWVDRVVINGKKLREVEVARAGVDATVWPEDAAYLDVLITNYTARRDKLLSKLRETA